MPALNKEQIKLYLLEQDQKLLPVISSVSYPRNRRNKDVYGALLYSIISQQLSVKASATIHARLLGLFPNNDPRPELLIHLSQEKLRSAGLSGQKAGYIKAIASVACDKGLAYGDLAKKSDSAIIERLTKIHGVGQWTVEMLLMSTFNRKDVMPVGDVGIQNAMRRLYGIEEKGKAFKEKLLLISDHWQPYRTIVCKYLWGWKANGYVDN